MTLFDNLAYKSDDFLERLIAAVEEGYEDKRRETGIVKKNSFSPSSIGYKFGRCARYHAMRFAGRYEDQKTGDLEGLARMAHGTVAHERIQSALEASKRVNVKELEREITYSDPPIRGFVDVVMELDEDGEELIVEIKTTRDEAFRYRVLNMKGPAYQMYQLLIYMYIEGAKRGVLLYENTNDKRLLAVPLEMTDENRKAVEDVFEWMRKIWDAHEKDLLPARPWKKTSPNCAECPLFNACWSEPREDIKIKSMTVHKW